MIKIVCQCGVELNPDIISEMDYIKIIASDGAVKIACQCGTETILIPQAQINIVTLQTVIDKVDELEAKVETMIGE
jgi:hypothetical protein